MAKTESYLDVFLNHQLLDIGDDDGRFAHLKTAAEAVRDDLQSDLPKLARYTRVGLDKDIDPDDPVVEEVEEKIKLSWKLIRNKHTERPVSIIRAVLWEGIRGAVEETPNALVVSLTGKSYAAHANLGPERESCQDFFRALGTRLDRLAEAEWTGQAAATVGEESGKSDAEPINVKLLGDKLLAACGPQGPEGEIKNANPHWPSTNESWSGEFSQRAAKAIADVVGANIKFASSKVYDLCHQFTADLRNARLATNRKTELLWWSEAQFCMTLECGFNEIANTALPFFLANDAQLIAPGISPQSLDYFLGHVVRTAATETTEIPIGVFVQELAASDHRTAITTILEGFPTASGRCGLLSFLKQLLSGQTQLNDLDCRLGIEPTKVIALADLAKYVFWELKAQNIARGIEPGEAND